MAKGYYLVQGDRTSCGGRILEGSQDHTILGKAVARDRDKVSCGIFPGVFMIAGGIANDVVHGRMMAGTLDSISSCPCRSRFIPSMLQDTYEKVASSSAAAAGSATETAPVLPGYLTGEKSPSGHRPDYPVLRNTHDLPDERVRMLMKSNNHDVMLLTAEETVEVLQEWGWADVKAGWVSFTLSAPGQWIINYGVNGRDIVTASMLIQKLGSFGIRATHYVNHKGSELIKLTGYPGIRKVLNAPVFAARNPKMVDLGLGKYGGAGIAKNVVSSARLTFYVAAAYRILDFILNDETSLAEFMGSLATDVVKIGVASVVSWGAGMAAGAVFPFVIGPTVAVVAVGLGAALLLSWLDEKFGVTDKVIEYIEAAQQEFVQKAREMEEGIWDLGAMLAGRMLEKGARVVESEIRAFIRDSLRGITPRIL
ncbi:PAAR domain-containing protein [Intestinirhabdus alba]|uniref:PAAR domain-containing protein n=1 Tax=Intestinirhabdus alba TaxID=2899544 RepID=A0A6L6IPI5_9ENTR|nr:PAAR domain-containing protein [Intestinirhabdus alba]